MDTSLAHENARLRALLQTQQDTIRQMAKYNRLLSQRVAAYASEINRLKALVAKLQRMQFGKSSEKLRAKTERQIQESTGANQRTSGRNGGKRWVSNMTRYCHPPCASLQPVNRYRPHFPVKPGSSGRKRNAARPVVVTSVLWGVMCQSNWSLSAAPLRLSKHNVRNWPVVGATISCRQQYLQKPIARSYAGAGASGPCCYREICRPSAVIPPVRNIPSPGRGAEPRHAGRWTGAVAELLEPLYDVLRQYVLMPGKVHADDIPVPVQEPGSGKTRTARLWVYVRDDRNAGSEMPPAVWFAYSPDRKGIHPQNHLAGYSGVLQADAYGGYRVLYESGRITEAACMAHARRKIHDVHARVPTDITTEALQRIGELYAIEAEVRGCTAEQRLAARKARAAPLMQSLYDWIQTQMKNTVASLGYGKSVRIPAETVGWPERVLQ
ncbi:IS66 family transposase orfB [Escherichia coli]|uniref:IS66 family transposase orfB n=1 Tax=Escherichia coli TaxID=562 RepID=A0A2X3KKY0_ECOLX|nr:IS66 family transposase orfB [Escherichia coli]